MPHYPKYTTTVIGAYSVPRWYEPFDRLVTMGQLLPEDMADAQHRVMQASGRRAGDGRNRHNHGWGDTPPNA
jgi:hypothetical protein